MTQQILTFLLLLENISLTALVNEINNLHLSFNLDSLQSKGKNNLQKQLPINVYEMYKTGR